MTVYLEIEEKNRKASNKMGLIVNRVIAVWDRDIHDEDPILLHCFETRTLNGFDRKIDFIQVKYGDYVVMAE
jgi:hypothetical protein